jgi:hypothetical protein
MKYTVLLFLLLVFAARLSASDYGTTGLIDMPTARMAADGTLKFTAALESPRLKSYSATYQATPWLEATFRYTGHYFPSFTYWDRNYEAKIKLWSETDYLPQVAIGIRDMVGTGFYASEYLVASKELGDFDFTLGMGWGRLAGTGDMANPLIQLADQFSTREVSASEGGELSYGRFFSGPDVGFFGGLSYQPGDLPVSLMLEYNPDQYDGELRIGGWARPESPWSAGVKWEPLPGVSLTFSRQHEDVWTVGLSAAADTKSIGRRRPAPRFKSSLDMAAKDLPSQLNPNDWYDMLLFDVERSGLVLVEASIEQSTHTAIIVLGNKEYPVWADAIAKMTTLADLHLPSHVKTFRFIAEELGHRVQTIQMPRPSWGSRKSKELLERRISVLPSRNLESPQRRTGFEENKLFLDVGLATRFQLFDPDDPARYQFYAPIGVTFLLPKSWLIRGVYGLNIENNFDESTRLESGSVLPQVRSDVVRYLIYGDSGLDSLYLEKRGTAFRGLHYRLFGGVLEDMFSGVGGEALYQPFQSRFAFGVSAARVRQRTYDKSFDLKGYEATTAFVSAYWASPFYNFDFAAHVGKYLAKDTGTTLEIRRTFNNGWMVGFWATRTDVSAADFGEGSFDKGFFLKIPFASLFGRNTRGAYATRIRPIQRDGGQRLEDFSGNIWWDTRSARYDAFGDLTNRMVP